MQDFPEGEHTIETKDGVAVFALPGGVSTVHVADGNAQIDVENYKGDLTIRIPQFDAHRGWTIDVSVSHRIVIASHDDKA